MSATIVLLIGLLSVLYFWFRKKYSYWESRGIKQLPGILPPWGNTFSVVTLRQAMGDLYCSAYDQNSNEPVVGMYDMLRPVLVVVDPRIVERVMVKDFVHFVDRVPPVQEHPDVNPMDLSLFSLNGNKWRAVRQKLVPTFTTGKMKAMMGRMERCAKEAIDQLPGDGVDCQLSDAIGTYVVNVIGSCIFGMDPSELSRPDSKFRAYSRQLFKLTTRGIVRILVMNNLPWLAKKLRLSFFDPEATEYFCSVVKKGFEERKDGQGRSDDFLSLLMQLKREGSVEIKSKDVNEEDDYLMTMKDEQVTEKIELTDVLLFGQALQFLTAGLEGISLAYVYLAHELSLNQEIQERLREEVESAIKDAGGILNYETLKRMTLLHNCILETLRLYPSGKMLFRYCVKDYALEETGTIIEAGTTVILPTWSLHRDPRYFDRPETFSPDRFDDQKTFTPGTYLAFGDGPRICIGMRLALLEIKIAVVELLRKFRIEPSPKTKLPIQFNKMDFLLSPSQPIYVKLRHI